MNHAEALTEVHSLADQFAANGYFTVIPDIWEGDNVPLNWEPTSSFNLGQWMSKHGPKKVEPIVEAAIHAMRNEHGVKKLAGAGYCLGAKYVSRFMAKGKGIDVGYFAHPSATSGDEVKGISGPLSIAAAGTSTDSRALRVQNPANMCKKPMLSSHQPSVMRPRRSLRK